MIRWRDWLAKWNMSGLKISLPFLEMEWQPGDADRKAAWELYIELLTRIATQPLPPDYGEEREALESVHQLFPLTREIIKRQGHDCFEFAKIAIVVLNQVIREFTAKWHRLDQQGKAFDNMKSCADFRDELSTLQGRLKIYTQMLADMAGVEDLTSLAANGEQVKITPCQSHDL